MTVIYWAWPKLGVGHAARAAAICRHLDDVVVIRGSHEDNWPLEMLDVPFLVVEGREEAERTAVSIDGPLVVDDHTGSPLDQHADLFIWRFGRSATGRTPVLRIEGRGAVGPIVMLDDSEILSMEEAREDLGIPVNRKRIVLGIESARYPELVRAMRPDFILDRQPALKWMRAATEVVGLCGANLFGEVLHLGLPARWGIAPDTSDQAIRTKLPPWEPVPDAARRVATMIRELETKESP